MGKGLKVKNFVFFAESELEIQQFKINVRLYSFVLAVPSNDSKTRINYELDTLPQPSLFDSTASSLIIFFTIIRRKEFYRKYHSNVLLKTCRLRSLLKGFHDF